MKKKKKKKKKHVRLKMLPGETEKKRRNSWHEDENPEFIQDYSESKEVNI